MNKNIYKLEIAYNKYSPLLISVLIIINNIFSYFGYVCPVAGYLFMPSILTSVHMYISVASFKFCKFHRTLVTYVVINTFLYIIKYYWIGFTGLLIIGLDITLLLIICILLYDRYNKAITC